MKHKAAVSIGLAIAILIGVTVVYSQQKSANSGAAASSGHLAKASFSSTRKADVQDSQYQMTAYTLDVPAGWKFAGTIARVGGCHGSGAALKYTMQSPDGQTALARLPGVTWSWNSSEQRRKSMEQAHCPGIDIDSAASFLVNIAVPNIHPGAKVIQVLPLEAEGQASLAKQLEQQKSQNANMAAQFHQPPQNLTLDGARVRIQYTRNGQAEEEEIGAVVGCIGTHQAAMFSLPASDNRICTSRGEWITRAPTGQLASFLALPQVKTLGKSIAINHEWDNRVAADTQAKFQRLQDQNNAQFQANMKANQAQFDQRIQQQKQFDANLKAGTDRAMAQDRARQNAIDASAHNTVNYSLDRQDYRNPNTGQIITADSGYNHQWISSDGSTLIQTNDHTFDPNGQVYPVSQSWSELTPQ